MRTRERAGQSLDELRAVWKARAVSPFLADAVVVAHATFVVFVALGGFLVLRWPRLAWFHLPAVAWGVVVELAGWVCPLTPLEIWLRGESYHDGFVAHYVEAWLYPPGLTREMQVALAAGVLALNAAVYSVRWIGRMPHRTRRRKA
jgi:hypothetical protein